MAFLLGGKFIQRQLCAATKPILRILFGMSTTFCALHQNSLSQIAILETQGADIAQECGDFQALVARL
jgi:hypothetical protein